MYEALEFAGYDVKLVMGTDGHSTKQGGAILPDALRWLWRGLSRAGRGARAGRRAAGRTRFFGVGLLDDLRRQAVAADRAAIIVSFASLTSDREGNVYFADPRTGTIERVGPAG